MRKTEVQGSLLFTGGYFPLQATESPVETSVSKFFEKGVDE